ncbi:hypothetical protein [Flavobacterium limnophilum]|uniref:hypothetical protein n=1 Tax=Flavobacterium limnophilum TaxID=3003262 RepID=UPI0024831156|nr:hypothetical protein [Flavobacterium limnophilum]
MSNEFYIQEQHRRVEKIYNKKKHSNFINKKGLADWYTTELRKNDCKCYYCETSIFDIIKLINLYKVKTRAVKGNGVRGPVLEIDKNDNIYSKETCVLACYYCNNDKSYTLDKEEYKQHFGENRKRFFDKLLQEVLQTKEDKN